MTKTDKNDQQISIKIQQVIQRELAWAQAHLDLDLDTINVIASEDYKQLQSDGTFKDKTELLASYGSGKRYWEVAKSSEHQVQIASDLAILIGRWYGKGINSGVEFDYCARFLSIYEWIDGTWKMILDVSIPEEE